MEPWERQPHESAKAYEAFCSYRDMGSSRSTAKVGQELGKTKALMDRWSSRWEWVWRCRQYDAFMGRQQQDKHQQDILDALDRHAYLARLMQNKSLEKMQSLNPADLPPSVLVQMVKVATDIELRSLGVATETIRTEVTGADGGPIQADTQVVVDGLSDPAIRNALKVLALGLEGDAGDDGKEVV